MKCDKCGETANSLTYRDDGRFCPGCSGNVFQSSAFLHEKAISRAKFGVTMSRVEAMRLKTNKKQPDGTWKAHPRYHGSD